MRSIAPTHPEGPRTWSARYRNQYFLDDTVVDGTILLLQCDAPSTPRGWVRAASRWRSLQGPRADVLPLHIDSDGELLALKWLYDWSGTGDMNGIFDPIMIQDLQGDRSTGRTAIYIANTTLGINIWNCSFNGRGSRVGRQVRQRHDGHVQSILRQHRRRRELPRCGNCSFEAGSVFVESSTACTVNTNTFLNSTSALFCIDTARLRFLVQPDRERGQRHLGRLSDRIPRLRRQPHHGQPDEAGEGPPIGASALPPTA